MRDYGHAFSHYKRAAELLGGPRLLIHCDYGRFLCIHTIHAPIGLVHLDAALQYAKARHDAEAAGEIARLIDMFRHEPAQLATEARLHAPSSACKHGKMESLSKAPVVSRATGQPVSPTDAGSKPEHVFASIEEIEE